MFLTARCFKCKESREMQSPIASHNGRAWMACGVCPNCGGKMSRIVNAETAAELPKAT